ncbi:DUF3006 domain-containing protein [Peribacillus psychrosaccharolyticus]|uniref:DUF3006 domain-containing protein n=1 Tax=Peribacillus psychrosaccharolyticus TaxID=1407 RepID=A0A974NNV8_PERPY|nr:DUF3006 domain-containing protein [Peribacillus psychrosaccharolyticus]MEC2053913.1 DUF3006 domain-containing protein [Peribacillus psychrosaccharolyticus]MED3742473.1 DUF3006 domain-containing protein [Peribacillus psychrosaccharolyticus]QQT01431.1 DUF3006 domain-containing protein [Peribacillus psychrosaccharolyticus]
MKGIVDRFEGEYAVIEVDGKTRDVKRNLFADSVRVSDVVILKNGKWERDSDETLKRKKEVKKLMDSVWED